MRLKATRRLDATERKDVCLGDDGDCHALFSVAPSSPVTPERLVDLIVEWQSEQTVKGPAEEAVIADLAPTLVGWAMARQFAQMGTRKPKQRGGAGFSARLRKVQKAFSGLRLPASAPPNNEAELLAICLQINSARAFLPVAKELRLARVETMFVSENGDTETQRLLEGEGFAYRTTASMSDATVATKVAWGAANLRHLWSRGVICDLLKRLDLPGSEAEGLGRRLRTSVIGGLFRAESALKTLRETPARNVLFITRRALFNSLLKHTHPAARHLFFLQGIVPAVPPIRTRLDVHGAFAGSALDLAYLKRCGIEDERISLTGYPLYDAFVHLDRVDCRKRFGEERSLDPDARWVLFTSQYETPLFSDHARMANLGVILELAERDPDTQFIIKLHPRGEAWEPARLPRNVKVDSQYPTAELIKAADAVATFWSTTAIEALILRTPLVQLNATHLPDLLLLPPELRVPIARDSHELGEALRAVIAAPPTSEEALEKWFGSPPDGLAAKRTAEAIAQATHQRGAPPTRVRLRCK